MRMRQVIDNMAGVVEVVASSDALAARARQQVELLVEEPQAGRVYRRDILPPPRRFCCMPVQLCDRARLVDAGLGCTCMHA